MLWKMTISEDKKLSKYIKHTLSLYRQGICPRCLNEPEMQTPCYVCYYYKGVSRLDLEMGKYPELAAELRSKFQGFKES